MSLRDAGYVVLRGLLPPEEVERCLRRLEQLSGRTRASFTGPRPWRIPILPRGTQGGWTLRRAPPPRPSPS